MRKSGVTFVQYGVECKSLSRQVLIIATSLLRRYAYKVFWYVCLRPRSATFELSPFPTERRYFHVFGIGTISVLLVVHGTYKGKPFTWMFLLPAIVCYAISKVSSRVWMQAGFSHADVSHRRYGSGTIKCKWKCCTLNRASAITCCI